MFLRIYSLCFIVLSMFASKPLIKNNNNNKIVQVPNNKIKIVADTTGQNHPNLSCVGSSQLGFARD